MKNQFEVYSAVISNFKDARRAYAKAIMSEGSAEKENAKVLDSLKAKMTAIQATMEKIATGDGTLTMITKQVLTLTNALLKLLNSDFGKFATLSTALVGLVKLKDINTASENTKGIAKALGTVADKAQYAKIAFEEAGRGIKGIKAGATELIGTTNLWIMGITAGLMLLSKAYEYFKQKEKEKTFDYRLEVLEKTNKELEESKQKESEIENKIKVIKDESLELTKNGNKLNKSEELRLTQLQAQEISLKAQLEAQKALTKEKEKQKKEDAKKTLEGNVKYTSFEGFETTSDTYGTGNTRGGGTGTTKTTTRAVENVRRGNVLDAIRAEEKALKDLNNQYKQGAITKDQFRNLSAKYSEGLNDNIDKLIKAKEAGVELTKADESLITAYVGLETQGNKAIDSEEGLVNALKDSTGGAITSMDDIKKAIESSGGSWEDFENLMADGKWTEALGMAVSAVSTDLGDFEKKLKDVGSSLKNVQTAYADMNTMAEEYNTQGFLSLDSLNTLLTNYSSYIQYMEIEGGQLKINKDGLKAMAMAKLEEARATVVTTAKTQISELMTRKDNATKKDGVKASNVFATAVTNAGNKALIAGKNAEKGSIGFEKLVKSMGMSKKERNKYDKELKSIEKQYNTSITLIDKAEANVDKLVTGQDKLTSSTKANTSARNANNEAMKRSVDLLKEEIDHYKSVISYIQGKVNDYIKQLEKQRDAEKSLIDDKINGLKDLKEKSKDYYDSEIKHLKELKEQEKEAWDAKIEALEKQNDAVQEQIKLQELQDALHKAENLRLKVYKEGEGFVYTQDTEAIKEAKKNLDDYIRQQNYKKELQELKDQRDAKVKNYEQQIKDLEDKRDKEQEKFEEEEKLLEKQKANIDAYYKNIIDHYQNWLDRFNDGINQYETEQNRLMALQLTGIDFEKQGWQQRLGNLDNFVNQYIAKLRQLAEAERSYSSASSSGGSGGGGGGGYSAPATTPKQKHLEYGAGISHQYKNSKGKWVSAKTKGGNITITKQTGTQAGDWIYGTNTNGTEMRFKVFDVNAYTKSGKMKYSYYNKGSNFIDSDQMAVVGDAPYSELVIGSKLNGVPMSLKKGSGVVNASATKTLAGILNNPQKITSMFSNAFSKVDTTKSEIFTIQNVNVDGGNIKDFNAFINSLQNLKNQARQRAYTKK